MVKVLKFLLIISIPATVLFFSSCKKDAVNSGVLSFSTDTLTFDTVFASLNSTTLSFKVYNKGSAAIKISDIRLLHLVGNQFRIAVDGDTVPAGPGGHFTNVEIEAKDSFYVFVEVTVDPTNSATPFVIIDDVQFTVGSNTQKVHLQAFGQNAHFHYGEEITSGIVNWNNDLPHVIITKGGNPGVIVDCGATLNINAGCKIYVSAGSAMFIEGTLNANINSSNWSDSVVFRGVRLEPFYENKPGQWFGIVFLRTGNCSPTGTFRHCIVDESQYGIYAGAGLSTNLDDYRGAAGRPVVTIDRTIVRNSQYNAVYGFNAKITATNSLFYAAGENLLKFGLGGIYNFNYCTIFNNGSSFVDHQKESLLLSNFVADGNSNVYPNPLIASFTNSVIYGSLDNEISFNNYADPRTDFDVNFSYSLLKNRVDTVLIFSDTTRVLFNKDPLFKSTSLADFTPLDTIGYHSPLVDFCPLTPGVTFDLYDLQRGVSIKGSGNVNDIGCIELQHP